MSQDHDKKRILVIDRQVSWCEFSAQVLQDEGFSVEKSDDYDQLVSQVDAPDLVLLGCMQVGSMEQQLITTLLKEHYHLLVLSAYISKAIIRDMYLQGVDDVVDKPYSPTALLNIVNQTFEHITRRENLVFK